MSVIYYPRHLNPLTIPLLANLIPTPHTPSVGDVVIGHAFSGLPALADLRESGAAQSGPGCYLLANHDRGREMRRLLQSRGASLRRERLGIEED